LTTTRPRPVLRTARPLVRAAMPGADARAGFLLGFGNVPRMSPEAFSGYVELQEVPVLVGVEFAV